MTSVEEIRAPGCGCLISSGVSYDKNSQPISAGVKKIFWPMRSVVRCLIELIVSVAVVTILEDGVRIFKEVEINRSIAVRCQATRSGVQRNKNRVCCGWLTVG